MAQRSLVLHHCMNSSEKVSSIPRRARLVVDREMLRNALVAGSLAAVTSGVPSTGYALLTGRSPLEASLAAGTLVLPLEQRTPPLLLAAAPLHLALSLGWALVLAAILPRKRTTELGALAGLGIAAVDLGLIGQRFPRVRALPHIPQVADHLAYGVTVGAVLSTRRSGQKKVVGVKIV